eukprot:778517-Rhodomonas_salina.1
MALHRCLHKRNSSGTASINGSAIAGINGTASVNGTASIIGIASITSTTAHESGPAGALCARLRPRTVTATMAVPLAYASSLCRLGRR